MKRHGFLFEKVCSFENLIDAGRKSFRGKKKSDRAARFVLNMESEVVKLQRELLSEEYRPKPYNCFMIYEPKQRSICASDLRDRVVHHAVCNVLEPVFEKVFIGDSYACRKGKGTHRAVKKAQGFSRRTNYFLKADIKLFFASIDHSVLKSLLARKIKDKKMLRLMAQIIDHPVPGHEPGKGLAIGNLTSQWWANYYLDLLDHYLKDQLGVKYYLRYMDDFVLFDNDKQRLHVLKAGIIDFIKSKLHLELKQRASYVSHIRQGLPFLGRRIFPGMIRLKHDNLVRFSRKFRSIMKLYEGEKISQEELIRSSAALIGSIQHADTLQMRRSFFNGMMEL